jgi:hypothetical protein
MDGLARDESWVHAFAGMTLGEKDGASYSTVTDFARFRGWSTSLPITTAVW